MNTANYRVVLYVNDYVEARTSERESQSAVNVRTKEQVMCEVSDALRLYGLKAEIYEVAKSRYGGL